jgi:hypothetical protein
MMVDLAIEAQQWLSRGSKKARQEERLAHEPFPALKCQALCLCPSGAILG